MRFKNKKSLLLEFPFYFIMAFILLWPFFVKAETVVLNEPGTSCIGPSINLTWNSDVINPSYYILRRPAGESTFTQIAGPISNTFFADNNIVSDKAYFYKIRAESGNNVYFSNEVQVLALYCPAVLSASPVIPCPADGPHISLNWSSVSGNLSRYEVYRDGVQISQTSNTNFDDNQNNNLEGTKNYNYLIKTVWQNGTTRDSETAPATALACPPVLTVISDCATEAPGGPRNNLSWNNLLGVQNYQIYRKAQSEINFSLLNTVTGTSYTDNLVESLPTYAQAGQVYYYVKAIWLTDQKDSSIQSANISRCSPYLKVESVCNSSGLLNPEMRLSWTATQGATLYNVYRNGSFYNQITNPNVTDFIDYLDSSPSGDCPNKICTHSYRVEAVVTGFPNFPSNQLAKDIDCATVIPPSPAPVLDPASAYCVSGDSRISLSWTASDNIIYYSLYRIGLTPIKIDLLETSYPDSGVESGYQYDYYVVAYGRGGNSTTSPNVQTITAVDCTPPSASTLTVTRACESGKPVVNLSWSQTSNTEAYEIWRATTTPTTFSFLITFDKTAPEFTSRTWKDANVAVSTNYYYKIVSKGPPGVPNSQSNVPGITTYSCLPTTPSVTVTPACSSTNPVVNLSWVTDATNTTRYEIFRQDWSQTIPIKIIYSTSTTNWQDTSVSPQTPYTYKVEAVGYISSQRSTQGWKPAITTYNCSVPGSFTLNDPPNLYCQGSYPRADLSWTPASNTTSYDLLRSVNNPATISGVNSPFSDWGFGNALSFNGTNNYVNVGNPANIPLTGSLSIEFWAYPTNIGSGRRNPICKNYYNEFCLTTESSNNGLSYYHGANSSNYLTFSVANIFTNNKWVHVVITRDMPTRTVKMYKNGVLVGSTTWTSARDPVSGSSSLYFGYGYSAYFIGTLDEIRLYNRPLSDTEIQDHFKGIYPNENNLIGLWHFDENYIPPSTTASDSTNYGNYGTLVNSPLWVQNGLQWQTNYSWQVRANAPGGNTLSNTTAPSQTPLYCAPTKPGLTIQNSFCNSGAVNTTLRWSFTTNTNQYEIYRNGALIKTIDKILDAAIFNSRTWTATSGLAEQTSYNYYIKAIGSAGESQSDIASHTTPSCAGPSQPQNLTAAFACGSTGNSYPRVNLSWSTTTNTTYYTVFRSTAGGSYTALAPPPTTPSFTDTNVNVNTNYSYYVIAYGPGGASLPSSPAATTTGYCSPSIPTITTLTTGCENNSSVNYIYWSDATTFNTFEYKIYRNTSDSPPAIPIATTSLLTWKDNSGLSYPNTYFYWIKAKGPAGESSYSSVKSIAAYSCGITPSAPTLNLDNLFCQDNLPYATLSWKSVINAYSYNLYRTNPDAIYSTRLSPQTDKGSSALSFDGVNDYLQAPNSSSLNPRNITMEAWIYPTAYNSSGNIISKRSVSAQYILRFYSTTGRIEAYVFSGGAWRPCTTDSTDIVPLNTWSHIASTYDGKDIKVFINGSQRKICTPNTGDIVAGTSPLTIGAYSSASERFKGSIDDVRIYGRALSASEVSDHYNGVYTNEADLRGVWHFDEGTGTGTLAYDQSGNSNNSALYNGPIWQTDSPNVLKVLPLERSKDYKYKVKSLGIGTESGFSNEISFTASSCLPAKPDLTVTSTCAVQDPQLFLDWSGDSNTSYWSIYKKRAEEPYLLLTNISPPQTDFTDKIVESGIDYEYYLTAVGNGTTTNSNAVPETASFCNPQPQKPVITATSTCYGYSSRSKIEWQSDLAGNTISCNVWRKNTSQGEPDFTEVFSDLPASAVEYLDTVPENQSYIYKIEAVGSGTGNNVFSDPSNEITSYECSKIPPFPPNLYLNFDPYAVNHLVAVSIGWSDSGNEENYKVFRRLSGESEFANSGQNWWQKIINILFDKVSAAYENPLVTLPSDILNYVDYTVTDGQTYEYQVMASNINGETLSNILQVAVPIARPGEFDLSGTRLPDYRVYLIWTEALTSEAGGEVTYDVLRSNTLTFDPFLVVCPGVIDPRACYDNDPPLLSTVYYKAIATNIGGITESDIVRVSLPVPIWKEIMPW